MCRRWPAACPGETHTPAAARRAAVAGRARLMPYSVVTAIVISVMMVATSIFIIFFHDRKNREFDQWVDYSFSGYTWRRALGYYRFMALSMLVFYVLFTCSCLLLQAEGILIFSDGQKPVSAGPIATSAFTLDLVLRGGFFDIMEHFELGISPVAMNRKQFWFVWYAFVFRMFFGLTLIKMFISFVWIYGKARLAVQADREARAGAHRTRY
jgi:hypothetical protein